jgi:hypothetical protein
MKTNIPMKLAYKSTKTEWRPEYNEEEEIEEIKEELFDKTKQFDQKLCRSLLPYSWILDEKVEILLM